MTTLATGQYPILDIASGFLNGDGVLDMVVVTVEFPGREAEEISINGNTAVAWFAGVGGGGVSTPPTSVLSTALDYPCAVEVADLDGDGGNDVVVASRNEWTVGWFPNTNPSSGTFGALVAISTISNGAFELAVVDLDGSGSLDVVVATLFSTRLEWFSNADGVGGFTGPHSIAPPDTIKNPSCVSVADVNGDSLLDVVFGAYNRSLIGYFPSSNSTGVPGYSWGPLVELSTDSDMVGEVVATCLDDDLWPDVVFVSSGDDTVGWFRALDGRGAFSDLRVISTLGDFPQALDVLDVDGDGHLDLLVGSSRDGSISWFRNLGGSGGEGTLFDSRSLVSSSVGAVYAVLSVDISGDSVPDVVTSAPSGTPDLYDLVGFPIDLSPQSFAPTSAVVASGVDRPSLAIAVDLDGDLDADVVALAYDADQVLWFRNLDSQGAFGPPVVVTQNAGDGPAGLVAADMDGDGDMDLASAALNSGDIIWYPNADGRGGFGPRIVIATIPAAFGLAVGDLDGDKHMDLVVSSFSPESAGDGNLVWIRNLGWGQSWASPSIIHGDTNGGRWVSLSDLNNDGSLDVIGTQHGPDTLSWYERLANGSFTQHIVSTTDTGVMHALAVDVDNDSNMDLVAALQAPGHLVWHRNLGPGSGYAFGSANVISTAVPGVWHIAAHDWDRDGYVDVAAACHGDGTVYWFRNQGGSFGIQEVVLSDLVQATSVFAADLDSDGDGDILSVGLSSNIIKWTARWTRSAFAPLAYTPTTLTPVGVAAGSANPSTHVCTQTPHSFACVSALLSSSSFCVSDTIVLPSSEGGDMYGCRQDSPLLVSHRVNIVGDEAGVTFDCQGSGTLLSLAPHIVLSPFGVAGSVTVSNVSISNAISGFTVSGPSTSLALDSVSMEGCHSSPDAGNGACVSVADGGSLHVASSVFRSGSSSGWGGAVFANGHSRLVVEDSVVEGCRASLGGGLAVVTDDPGSTVLSNVRVVGNTAGVVGGGLVLVDSVSTAATAAGAASITDIPQSTKSAQYLEDPPVVLLDSVVLQGNVGGVGGGGMFVCGSMVSVLGAAGTAWESNRVVSSPVLRSSGDALLCHSPHFGGGATPNRGDPDSLPWLVVERAVFEAGLGESASIHTPIVSLLWTRRPEPRIQSGQSLTGSLEAADGMGQRVVYGSTLVRTAIESSAIGDLPITSTTALFGEQTPTLVVSSIPATVTSGELVPANGSYSVGLVRADGETEVLLTGSFGIQSCLPGYGVANEGVSLVCLPCVEGTVSVITGFETCATCPANSVGTQGVNGTCLCVPSTFEVEDPESRTGMRCNPCPVGGVCVGGLAPPVAAPGFFPETPGSINFLSCERDGCAGAAACKRGYTGFLCAKCSPGFYSSSEAECSPCPSGASGRLVGALLGLSAAACGFATFVAWSAARVAEVAAKTASTSRQRHIIAFRTRTAPVSVSIVFVVLQVVAIMAKGNWGWSEESKVLFGMFSFLNVDAQAVAAECTLRSFHVVYVVGIFVPVAVLGSVVLLALGLKAGHRVFPFLSGLELVSSATLRDAVLFTLAPLLYIPVSRAALVLFDCSRLPSASGDKTTFVLDADQGVPCFDDAWFGLLPLGLIAVFGFVLGLPLWFARTIWVRKVRLFDPDVTIRFGALYRNFRRAYYWGEIGNLGKRLAIVVVATFLSKHQLAQLGLLLLIFIGSLGFVIARRPYFVPLYNEIDVRLTCVLIGILLLGAGSYAERDRESASGFFFVASILALVMLVGVSAHSVYIDVVSLWEERKSEFYAVNERQRALIGHISTELNDVEPDAALLHAMGEFLATLNNTVCDQSLSRVRTAGLGTDAAPAAAVEMEEL